MAWVWAFFLTHLLLAFFRLLQSFAFQKSDQTSYLLLSIR